MIEPPLSLLSRLWLSEPEAKTIAAAREAGFGCDGDASDLAAAWTDLFLLNVYPYASTFLDLSGDLNGPSAASALARFEAERYSPPELAEVAAPDHAGLCLDFLDRSERTGRGAGEFLAWTLDWIPVCAIAVERQPSAHPFYRSVAAATREALLERATPSTQGRLASVEPPCRDELDLSAVLARLLAPASSGLFLSRSRLGKIALDAGMRLPFASRRDVARALFESAGEGGRVRKVLGGLRREAAAWDEAYTAIAARHSAWRTRAASWRARLAGTLELLSEMAGVLDSPLEVEYGSAEETGGGGS